MRLRDFPFKRAYHKPEDDIARDFYLPAVGASIRYDRAVGFFSSSVFLLAWPSLKTFAAAGGKMRLICSPILSDDDHEALREGYSEKAEAAAGEAIAEAFQRLVTSDEFRKPAVVLASLVATGVIECKIAWVGPEAGGRPKRLFHDKVGILTDLDGDQVAFKGSMNETWPGLARDGNLESVDVFASWRDKGEFSRVLDEAEYFERLWNDDWPDVTVRPLPETARSAIVSSADAGRWPEFVDEICLDLDKAARWSADAGKTDGRTPRPHQVAALEAWEGRGRRGILEHATGSGKTFTALCAIGDSLRRRETPLILVPSELLLQQWDEEVRAAFSGGGLQLMTCGGGHDRWRQGAGLRGWTRPHLDGAPRAVLATLQTASGDEFRGLCAQGDHLFMVADEVHRLGAVAARRLFELETGPRLGLSATPQRAGDPEGTAALMAYFEGVVPPPFTLADAIKAKALTPYAYQVHTVRLDRDERDAWNQITERIRRLYARAMSGGDLDAGVSAGLKLLLIQRARIIKGARAKTSLAAEIVEAHYRPGQRWIVYCDDQDQLGEVKAALRARDLRNVYEYHSAMPGDRKATLDVFNERGGVVVSIRCLDEGVDIPAVSHALILASSRNPREFIQRRGRVLRRSPGKVLAYLHDVIVVPEIEDDDYLGGSVLKGELARAIEFGGGAVNPAAVADLKRIAAAAGLDWEAMTGAGFELDSDEDTGDSVAASTKETTIV
jgi:superfamily II DNA or RNA helicase